MGKYLKNYKKIVDELVKKSYPKLNPKFIWVTKSPIQISWPSASITYFGFAAWIVVFPKAKNYSEDHLRGLLAHELAHYELILNMNFIEKLKFAFKWLFTKKGKAWFETEADKYAIKKGYFRGLYSLILKLEKSMDKERFYRRKDRGYLSSKQIKAYAKKIGKW